MDKADTHKVERSEKSANDSKYSFKEGDMQFKGKDSVETAQDPAKPRLDTIPESVASDLANFNSKRQSNAQKPKSSTAGQADKLLSQKKPAPKEEAQKKDSLLKPPSNRYSSAKNPPGAQNRRDSSEVQRRDDEPELLNKSTENTNAKTAINSNANSIRESKELLHEEKPDIQEKKPSKRNLTEERRDRQPSDRRISQDPHLRE